MVFSVGVGEGCGCREGFGAKRAASLSHISDASASVLTITPGLAMQHNKLPPPWKYDSFEQSFHHSRLSVDRANQRLVTAEFCWNGSGRQG
jgi:hypothetical protein